MAKVWCGTFAAANPSVAGANVARFFRLFGDMFDAATATSQVLTTWRGAGTLSELQVRISANTRTDATTIQLLVNGSPAGATITVPATTVGTFAWTFGQTLALADGDTICLRVTNGPAAANSLSVRSITFAFEGAGGVTSGMHSLTVNQLVTTAAAFFGGVDGASMSGAEARQTTPAAVPGKWSNLQTLASTNSFTLGLDTILRVNTADSALLVNLPTLALGPVEDTTNTVTVALNDNINFSSRRAGAGSGSVNQAWITARFVSAGSAWEIGSSYAGSTVFISTAADTFYPVMGDTSEGSATESDVQLAAPFDMYLFDLRAGFSGVASTNPFGLTLRVNGVDTALTGSFPAATANATLRNNANVVFIKKGDLLSLRGTAPTAGNRNMNYIRLAMDTAPPPAVLTSPDVFNVPSRPSRNRTRQKAQLTYEQIRLISTFSYGVYGGFGFEMPPRRRLKEALFDTTTFVPVLERRRAFLYSQV